MKPHLHYLSYVLRHKWFVFLAGLRVGVPVWRLIVHDWDKFLPRMWIPYVNQFHRSDAPAGMSSVGYLHDKESAKAAFNVAWESHWRRHGHHWDHWVNRDPAVASRWAKEMPEVLVREMLADWMGAGRAQGVGWDVRPWYAVNGERMTLHPQTRILIEQLIAAYFPDPLPATVAGD